MIRTKGFLVDRQRALVERFSVGVAALVAVEPSQVVQRCRNVGMIRTKGFLVDRQRALVERLGRVVATLVAVEQSQVV